MPQPVVNELGKYQWEFLNKYGRINLSEWRMDCMEQRIDWFYVGRWEWVGLEGNCPDGEAACQRHNNLAGNPYFYWPNT